MARAFRICMRPLYWMMSYASVGYDGVSCLGRNWDEVVGIDIFSCSGSYVVKSCMAAGTA